MKLLIDNALSPRLADLLNALGHDAIHVRDRIPPNAPDHEVFQLAADERRILVSADSDFGVILANRPHPSPSLILLRHDAPGHPSLQAPLIARVLQAAAVELTDGCVISVTKTRIRLRMLPLA